LTCERPLWDSRNVKIDAKFPKKEALNNKNRA